MEQCAFRFDAVLERNGRITRKFWEFHRDNPEVYNSLKKLAFDLKNCGHKRYGIKGLFEVLRWQHSLKTNGSRFKLNNNYTMHYARLIMEKEPELFGFFETRESPFTSQVIE